jgi:hypothetical protein
MPVAEKVQSRVVVKRETTRTLNTLTTVPTKKNPFVDRAKVTSEPVPQTTGK